MPLFRDAVVEDPPDPPAATTSSSSSSSSSSFASRVRSALAVIFAQDREVRSALSSKHVVVRDVHTGEDDILHVLVTGATRIPDHLTPRIRRRLAQAVQGRRMPPIKWHVEEKGPDAIEREVERLQRWLVGQGERLPIVGSPRNGDADADDADDVDDDDDDDDTYYVKQMMAMRRRSSSYDTLVTTAPGGATRTTSSSSSWLVAAGLKVGDAVYVRDMPKWQIEEWCREGEEGKRRLRERVARRAARWAEYTRREVRGGGENRWEPI